MVGVGGCVERATRGILGEFLAMYGKVPDLEKEEKRLGQMHKESAAEIVRDYELPMSGEEFSEAIMPLYKERWEFSPKKKLNLLHFDEKD